MSVTVRAVDSGVGVCTISVTGRMERDGVVVLTVSMTGGMEESAEGVSPESMVGGGVDEGEIVAGFGEVGEGGEMSLTKGEVESNCGCWESITPGMGDSLVEGIDGGSSTTSNCMGMSEFALMEGGGSLER